jgi:hypothetical protein
MLVIFQPLNIFLTQERHGLPGPLEPVVMPFFLWSLRRESVLHQGHGPLSRSKLHQFRNIPDRILLLFPGHYPPTAEYAHHNAALEMGLLPVPVQQNLAVR